MKAKKSINLGIKKTVKRKLSIPKNDMNENNENLTSKKRFFIETISKFCDKCGSAYEPKDVQIIQETSFSSIIHFSCRTCKSTHIATFLRPVGISSRMPLNSDLNVREINKFAQAPVVSTDEILDLYTKFESGDQPVKI